MIEQVQCAISMEESRYTLNGAKFDATNGRMQLAASDGHRLSHAVMPIQMAEGSKLDVLVPRKTLAEIPRLLADAAEKVTISQRQDDNRTDLCDGQQWSRAGQQIAVRTIPEH
jgi:DNA polymerase-3 subunit beta